MTTIKAQRELIREDDEQVLYVEGSRNRTLYEILRWWKNGTLQKPPHQRGKVWPKEKVRDFIDGRLVNFRKPTIPGVIVTYQIEGEFGLTPRYLNDGLQRISCLEEFHDNYIHYGIASKEAVEAIFEMIEIPVQHFVYDSPENAYLEFVDLNYGTLCSSYEAGLGILSYMNNSAHWLQLFSEIHKNSATQGALVTGKSKMTRNEKHKYSRHDYHLFWMFSSGSKELKDANSTTAVLKPSQVRNKSIQITEYLLKEYIKEKDMEWAKREVNRFNNHVISESVFISSVWEEVKKSGKIKTKKDLKSIDNLKLTFTLYRWLLFLSVWRRNNNIPREKHREFLTSLLINSAGAGSVFDPDDVRKKVNLGADRLAGLRLIGEIIGVDLTKDFKRENRSREQVGDGFHISHQMPFSVAGEGEVFIESAVDNLSRGAAPVTQK